MHFLSLSQSVDTNVIETIYRNSINLTLERLFSTRKSKEKWKKKKWFIVIYVFKWWSKWSYCESFTVMGYLISDQRNWKMIFITIDDIFSIWYVWKGFSIEVNEMDILRNWIHQSQHDQDFEGSFCHQKNKTFVVN